MSFPDPERLDKLVDFGDMRSVMYVVSRKGRTYRVQYLISLHRVLVVDFITAHVRSTRGCYVFRLFALGGGGTLKFCVRDCLVLTSTDPMSFPGGTHPHPIILPLITCPFWGGGVPQSPPRGMPVPGGKVRMRYPSGQVRMGYPPWYDWCPPLWDKLHLDRLCCGW